MKKYIGLHIFSILLTIAATVFCGIMIVDYYTAEDGLQKGASLVLGIIFAAYGAGAYLIASILGGIGWGLRKKHGNSYGLFVVETILPIILAIAVFATYLLNA